LLFYSILFYSDILTETISFANLDKLVFLQFRLKYILIY